MYAHLNSTRLAPKKANLMAKLVRGMTVPDAMELLRNTSKKSARLFEGVLQSAIANAQHNFKQDAQTMVLKSVVVNQGTAYRRGIPMARGRVRPIRKFLCHITITLGFAGDKEMMKPRTSSITKRVKRDKKTDSASQTPKAPVQTSAAKPKAAPKKTSTSTSASKK